jgi:polyphosphate glucokinase
LTLLGIDIGGTGIKGAPVDVGTGQLVGERFRLETPQPAVPNAVADVVEKVAAHFNYQGPTGVAFPAVVKHGVTYTAANVDRSWIGTNAGELFSRHVGGPVTVVNDADAAGIAEIRFGAGRDRKGVVILLTLGTGIGSAIFLNGELIPNTEFGHLIIRGKEAEKRASEKVREDKKLSWRQWAKRLSEFLNEMEKLFSPDLFIMGGGISKKADKFIPYLTTKTEVIVVPALMRNEAGIIGAAYLAHVGGVGAGP